MGDFLSKVFVDLDSLPNDGYGLVQVLFLGGCYLYILLIGANMIGDGSELLMLVPSIAGLVGSVVLPVLGAVPDGAIILFSGLGPASEAESQVSVGVGALAGSTVMLLTVPWFLSIVGGRVPIVRGEPQYAKPRAVEVGCCSSGVAASSTIRVNALVMFVTSLTYFIVEIPALVFINESKVTEAEDIRPFAFAGTVVCAVMFVGYVCLQARLAAQASSPQAGADGSALSAQAAWLEQRINDNIVRAIAKGQLSLRTALLRSMPEGTQLESAAHGNPPLLSAQEQAVRTEKLRSVVRPFFKRFDTSGDGMLDRDEMRVLIATLGERPTHAEFDAIFTGSDTNNDGMISFEEFVAWVDGLLHRDQAPPQAGARQSLGAAGRDVIARDGAFQLESTGTQDAAPSAGNDGAEAEEDEGEDEMPEDLRDLPPEKQQRRILQRAFWQMGVGTALVLLFSDPMCDVLSSIGKRINVPAFFVAFLIGPLASNASEIVAAYKYAQKKTQKSISVSFSQLLGAACMNNTFCLLIFYMLVAARGFAWTYHAEVASIIFVQVVMAVVASQHVHSMASGLLVLSLLPLSLVLVAVLKSTVFQKVEG